MNIKISIKNDETTWGELANLLHESFQERLAQGLHFTCSYLTAEQLKSQSAGRIVLLAVDADKNNTLAGTVSIEFNEKDSNSVWAYHCNLAVSSLYKSRGIASLLFDRFQEIARSEGCTHIISDTAVGATSSVKWHLKNGFKKIGVRSFKSTNYYSVLFRKQLKYHWLWSNNTLCSIYYIMSFVLCHLYKNKDGSLTRFGVCLNRVRVVCMK